MTAVLLSPPAQAAAQAPRVRLGANAVPIYTYADPVPRGGTLGEIRLVQPVLMAHGGAFAERLRLVATLNLEGLTMPNGELAPGDWGEGFVDRRHPDRTGILKRWRALVSEGLSLIIFAEGTRSWDGRTARFKAGSFLLAIEAGLPIVPIAVIGTRQVMPKGRLRTEPADVELIVHDPIEPPALTAPTVRDAKTLADRVHAIVAAAVDARQFPAPV